MAKRTALYEEHQRLKGRIIDFGGWELPVQYQGLAAEHTACRDSVGIFDVSHMGEFHLEGSDAEKFLNYAVTNDVSRLADGQALYTVMCHSHGGIVDDLVIYKRAADKFLVVVNAANTEKDFAHLRTLQEAFTGNFSLTDESDQYTQIALQGRKAQSVLEKLTSADLDAIQTYWFVEGQVLGDVPAIIARTGYTGEDGFEIYVDWNAGPDVWKALLEAGEEFGIQACGLGARDTLRMEMKYPLYGHELSDETNPIEARLGWVVKTEKGEFVGRDAIVQVKEEGAKRALVGIQMKERGIPRDGYDVYAPDEDRTIGSVTSGTQSPSLKEAIGIAYLEKEFAKVGNQIRIDVRGRKIRAEVVKTPFYQRPY